MIETKNVFFLALDVYISAVNVSWRLGLFYSIQCQQQPVSAVFHLKLHLTRLMAASTGIKIGRNL